jgi:hypothetical protein
LENACDSFGNNANGLIDKDVVGFDEMETAQ